MGCGAGPLRHSWPTVTNYARGVRVERLARDYGLTELGYHTCVRAAGSKGWADLVFVGDDSVALVQVKNRTLSEANLRRMFEDAPRPLPDNVRCEVWEYLGGGYWRIH